MTINRRIVSLHIEGYRSIAGPIDIKFPQGKPLILLGENNTGKSNIVRALDLVLGEFWPGAHKPEDHEFWGRTPADGEIEIRVRVAGIRGTYNRSVRSIVWRHDGKEVQYQAEYDESDYTGKYSGGVSNEIREQCTVVVIGVERNLDYQMSYRTKWTLLSKLMRKFHQALISDNDRVSALKQKFHEVKAIFQEVEEFANFQETLQLHFDTMLEGMTYSLGIDFSAYDPSNYFRSLRIFPIEDGNVRAFEELGTGQAQLLAFAFAHAYAKAFYGGIVLVVEEPEAHLHPLAQRWLSRKIHQMAQDGLQVVITTHSPLFIDVMGLPGMVLVRKDEEGGTVVKQISAADLAQHCVLHGAPKHLVNEQTVLPFYAASSTSEILSGLFARKVILVEGPTEQLALPVYLRRVGLDTDRQGIAIIPVFGKGNLARWWRFFSAYDIPTYVIFDNDSKDDKRAIKRIDALRTLGVPVEDVEGYITANEWIIEDTFAVFGVDFETVLKQHFPLYEQMEQRAHATLHTTAKPLVARFVAEHIPGDVSKGWERIKMLKQKIEALSTASRISEA